MRVLATLQFAALSLALTAHQTTWSASLCDSYGLKEAATTQIQYDSSNLWKVRSPNGNEGYIFGIIHTTDPRIVNRYSELHALAYQADLYFSEIDFSNDSVSLMVEAANGANSLATLDDATMEQLTKIATRRRASLDDLKSKTDWYLWSELSRPLERGLGIDYQFWAARQRVNRPIVALEEMTHLIQVLSQFPDSRSVLLDLICQYDVMERQVSDLKRAFLDENWPAFYRESYRWESREAGVSHRFHEQLILGRNRIMVETLERNLKPEQTFFVTVGLAHLGGDRGLLDILVNKGYTLQPLKMSEASLLARPVRESVVRNQSKKIQTAVEWLRTQTPIAIPAMQKTPDLRFVTQNEMTQIACGGQRCDLAAHLSGDTILVNDSHFTALINGEEFLIGSIVHELVLWHKRAIEGAQNYCSNWQSHETEAYMIQNQYLAAHGTSIARRSYVPLPAECAGKP